MNLTLLFIVATAGSASVGAFQPAPKPTLAKNNVKQVNTSTGGSPPSPLTKSDMVAIRSPFGNSFPSTGDDANIDYVVDRDYGVALTLLCVGIWLSLFGPSDSMFIDGLGGAFHLWFGSFVGFQTMKTRVVFNKDTFELKTVTNHVLGLQRDKGLKPKEYTNYVLGTNNEWRYDSFVNWDFYPCMQLPILVYFKETQTPKEMQIKGSLGGRQMDRRDNGQMHWFPAFGNARQIREQFEAHGCAKIGTVSGEEYGNLKQP